MPTGAQVVPRWKSERIPHSPEVDHRPFLGGQRLDARVLLLPPADGSFESQLSQRARPTGQLQEQALIGISDVALQMLDDLRDPVRDRIAMEMKRGSRRAERTLVVEIRLQRPDR